MNGIVALTNQTPEIPVPLDWAYQSAPGDFFWMGFGIVFGAGLLSIVVLAIKRRMVGGSDYE